MITAADVISPVGPLTVDLLTALQPGVTAADVAAAYVAAAETAVATWVITGTRRDAGWLAFTAYRALSDRAQQILTGAMSASGDGEGSVSFSATQAAALQKLADSYHETYLALLEEELSADAPTVDAPIRPVSIPTVFTW